jgi:competence protein ComEA
MDKKYYWFGGFIIVGILLGAGIIYLVTRPPKGNPITLLPPPTPAPVTIYITGEVNHAGLYSLPVGSRFNDAILAAGGFTSEADTSSVNLAQILEDGQKIDIPGINNPASPGTQNGLGQPMEGVININTATVDQLDTLPGIGTKTAQDIIDFRSSNGDFTTIEDIMDVPGIGQGKFEAIKDLITVGTSP